MSKNFRDFGQRRAAANHLRRQTVAEEVGGAAARALHLRVLESATDDVANDGRSTQTNVGRQGAHEHASRGARPMICAEVVC